MGYDIVSLILDLQRAVRSRQAADGSSPPQKAGSPFPVASVPQLERTEGLLGFPLPLVLRRIYLEVGNGGFGPECGLLGIEGDADDGAGCTLVQKWFDAREDVLLHPRLKKLRPDYRFLPCVYCGCAVYLCLSGEFPEGPMWLYDQGARSRAKKFGVQTFTFSALLRLWLDRRDRAEPTVVPDGGGDA